MDSVFQFSKKDILGGKIYPVAWYRVRLGDLTVEPSKNLEKPSTNFSFKNSTILFDADTGDTTYAEHPITIMFNSLALGFAKGFLVALGVDEDSIDENTRFDFKNAQGKELDVYIENDIYQGRPVNRVNHKYRLPRQA